MINIKSILNVVNEKEESNLLKEEIFSDIEFIENILDDKLEMDRYVKKFFDFFNEKIKSHSESSNLHIFNGLYSEYIKVPCRDNYRYLSIVKPIESINSSLSIEVYENNQFGLDEEIVADDREIGINISYVSNNKVEGTEHVDGLNYTYEYYKKIGEVSSDIVVVEFDENIKRLIHEIDINAWKERLSSVESVTLDGGEIKINQEILKLAEEVFKIKDTLEHATPKYFLNGTLYNTLEELFENGIVIS